MLVVMLFDWWLFITVVFGLGTGRCYIMRTAPKRGSSSSNSSNSSSNSSSSRNNGGTRLNAKLSNVLIGDNGSGGRDDVGSDGGFTLDPGGGTPCCDDT